MLRSILLALTLVSAALFLLPACGGADDDSVVGDDDTAAGGDLPPVSLRLEAELPYFPGNGEDEELMLLGATYMVGADMADPTTLVVVDDDEVREITVSLPGYGHAPCQVRRIPDPTQLGGAALKVTLEGYPGYPEELRAASHLVDGETEFTIHDSSVLTVPLNRDLGGVWDCDDPIGGATQWDVTARFGGEVTELWWEHQGFVLGHRLALDFSDTDTGIVEGQIDQDGNSWSSVVEGWGDLICQRH